MQYRSLGGSGVRLSAVGLGSWLMYGGSVEENTARRCIERAVELGVNFIDTANAYDRGRAEEVVGRALSSYPRESYVLATKVYFPMGEGPNDRGLSRKHVFEQCHQSLRRLGVDYIDLYQCHRWDEETPLEETCGIMDDLSRQGKILYWGVSEWAAAQIREAVAICRARGWRSPSSNQPEYNALQRAVEREVLPATRELDLGNVVWSPLAQGVLTGKYRSLAAVPEGSRAAGPQSGFMRRYWRAEVLDAVGRLAPLAAKAGCSMAQLALAWCLRRPEVTSVIVGATSPRHVDDNVAAADLEIDPEVLGEMSRRLDPVLAEPI
ncbi:MAG TPA: aldo/keto reductase family protein [Gemmatimonadota bacterium]|nr:aldo/keto reductase family protein [Gemmatimonadota bacterium]